MPYDTKAIANLILDKGRRLRVSISPMKLQKLVYFAHGWRLALENKPLIDEPIEAWQYGPVVESLYHEFKRFGTSEIKGLATEWDEEDQQLVAPVLSASSRAQVEPLLDRIFEVYGGYTAVKLSNMTHEQGSPWAVARESAPYNRHIVIDDKSIREYFRRELVDQ